MLSLKLKEKDQELKLNELKYKELRKQMPYKRLKPLKSRRNTTTGRYEQDQAFFTSLPQHHLVQDRIRANRSKPTAGISERKQNISPLYRKLPGIESHLTNLTNPVTSRQESVLSKGKQTNLTQAKRDL